MSAPELSLLQLQYLNDLYYNKKMFMGRDRLYKYIRENNPEMKISRRQVAEFLSKQEINQLHQDSKGTPNTFQGTITEPHKILGIDLVDLSNHEKNGYKWLLNGVDLGSRKLYSIPLKSKTQQDVLDGFKKMMKDVKKMSIIRSDNGSEFKNRKMTSYIKNEGMKQVFSDPYSPQSNGAIERFNGVLKKLLFKTLQMEPDFKWYLQKELNILVDNINNTQTRGIKDTPQNIEKAYKEENKEKLKQAYENDLKYKKNKLQTQEFNVGDTVRIYMPSDKEKSNHWSKEIHKVEKVFKPRKENSIYEYKVNDYTDKFKQEELLKVSKYTQQNIDKIEKFIVSKLVKPVIHKNTPSYEVQWKNYKNQNTIEPRNILLEDISKTLNLYEKKNGIIFYQEKKTKKWRFKRDIKD